MSAPKHIQTLRSSAAEVATANTNRDATGTITTIITGAATGTVLQRLNFARKGSTTAGRLAVWLNDGSYRFLFEIIVPPNTVAVGTPGVPAWNYTWRGSINLPTTAFSIRVQTQIAETFDVTADGGDF